MIKINLVLIKARRLSILAVSVDSVWRTPSPIDSVSAASVPPGDQQGGSMFYGDKVTYLIYDTLFGTSLEPLCVAS